MTGKEIRRLVKRFVDDLGFPATRDCVYVTRHGKGPNARVHARVPRDPYVEDFHFGEAAPIRMELYEPRSEWPGVPLGEYNMTLEALRALIVIDDVMTS